MKILLTILLATSLNAQVAHWKLDDNFGVIATDAMGIANGMLVNGPTWVQGKFGGGLQFNGVDNRVDLGFIDIDSPQLSITLWFRADDFGSSDARFISKANGTSTNDHLWLVGTESGQALRFRLKTTDGTTTALATTTQAVQSGIWYFVAAIYDGSRMMIYRNVELLASTPKTGRVAIDPTARASIGSNPDGYQPFDGIIDDVRIYDRALSTEELQALFDGPPNPPDTTVQADGPIVTLSWQPNSEPDLAGYKVFTGLQSRNYSTTVDVGNVTQYAFAGLETNFLHYFAATAYDAAGNESGYSEEVSAFLLPAQAITWAAPRFKLLQDTLGLTKEALISSPPLLDTLEVADALWIATWKDSSVAVAEGWDIEGADSLVYRLRFDATEEFYTQVAGKPELWLINADLNEVFEISVSAHKSGGQATFAESVYFRNIKKRGFILLQLRRN